MRTLYFLIMATLCFNFTIAKGQLLNKKVSIQYKNESIEHILNDISKNYHVNFSYSSNFIPSTRKVTINTKEKSLSAVLSELLRGSDVSFEEVGSQIVLKKNYKKEDSKNKLTTKDKSFNANTGSAKDSLQTTALEKSPEPEAITSNRDNYVPESKPNVFFEEPHLEDKIMSDTVDKQTLRRQYQEEKRKLRNQYYSKLDSIENSGNQKSEGNLKNEFKRVTKKLHMELNAIGDSLKKKHYFRAKDSLEYHNKKEVQDTGKYLYRPGQVTLLPPWGTNGIESPRIINNISFNVLAGVNGGVEGFELGSLVNVDKNYVLGAQVAGLGNVVTNEVTGAQVSGLFNISGGLVEGAQVSGFMNLARGNAHAFQGAGFMNFTGKNCEGGQFAGFTNITFGRLNGVQAAGFSNIANGEIEGAQLAGFTNVANGDVEGAQLAGFANVAKGDVEGTQISGFANVASDDVKGTQVAGFINVAPDTLEGTQVAGFMNVGDKVKGSQIGFFNYADSVSGVQIGFLSISRKGYRRLELWGSETLYGNIAFKTGTNHFYNIFAAGASPKNNVLSMGLGYGFGSEIKLSNRMLMNLDALCFYIHQDRNNWNEFNLLNQLRMNLGFRVANRTSIFLGPTLNVSVSNHFNSDTGRYGLSLNPSSTFFNKTYSDNTNVAMWIGFNAGIRF